MRCAGDASIPCCVVCGGVGKEMDFGQGVALMAQRLERRLHPPGRGKGGTRALNVASQILPQGLSNLTISAAEAARLLAVGSQKLLGVESIVAKHQNVRRVNATHDPRAVNDPDVSADEVGGAAFGSMNFTHVLGLLAVCSGSTPGLLCLLLMLRLHPVIGRHMDSTELRMQ